MDNFLTRYLSARTLPAQGDNPALTAGVPQGNFFSLLSMAAWTLGKINYRNPLGGDQIEKAYRSISWFRAAIDRTAATVCSLPFEAGALSADALPADVAAIKALLAYPNKQDSLKSLVWRTVVRLRLRGAAYWAVAWDGKNPISLYWMHGQVIPVTDKMGNYISFKQVVNGATKDLLPNQVVPIYMPDYQYAGGRSPAEALNCAIETEQLLDNLLTRFFKSGSTRRVIITANKKAGKSETLRNMEALNTIHAQAVTQWESVMLEGDDLKVFPFDYNPAELQLAQLRKDIRDEILAVLQVPPSKMGMMSGQADVTEAQDDAFYREIARPIGETIADSINHFLANRAGIIGAGLICKDRNPDPRSKNRSEINLTRTGSIKRNELRESNGWDTYPGDPWYDAPATAVTAPPANSGLSSVAPLSAAPKKEAPPETLSTDNPNYKVIAHLVATHQPKLSREFAKLKNSVLAELSAQWRKTDLSLSGNKISATIKTVKDTKLPQLLINMQSDGYAEGAENSIAEYNFDFSFSSVPAAAWSDIKTRAANLSESTLAALISGNGEIAGLQSILTEAMQNGSSLETASRQVSELFDSGFQDWKAERIARTELHTSYVNGRIDTLEQGGAVGAEIILGASPCEWCRDEAARVMTLSEAKESMMNPERHPNCTCQLAARFEEE